MPHFGPTRQAPHQHKHLSACLSRSLSCGTQAKGLIRRRHGTNTYDLTTEGLRVAIFYTKVYNRLLRPLIAADQPPAPAGLRRALATIDRHVNTYTDQARLGKAA
jgi:hypothetical protein